ncbi:MAG: aspartate kinase [Cytophagales bacterium]|nr:aspartate kinase [Cytophagales bacterium]MDW8384662.1 aspartate kinase [Flammeovirgaceae bacterium]
MIVQKFGGTSVGKPERMHHVARLVNDGNKKIVVLSAVSGTTNTLVKISSTFLERKEDEAKQLIKELRMFYYDFVEKLYTTSSSKEKGLSYVNQIFDYLNSFSSKGFSSKEERIFLAQGELISTHLMYYYMQEQGISATLIPALEFMRTEEGEPDMPYIEKNLAKFLEKSKENIILTQGYICLNEFGEIDNLKRGGSDYTASIIGAAVRADVVEIWTDIDGMHNNDPRVVKNTVPVHEITFEEAAELAYFGAKILHPSSVLPAMKCNIPVKLLNTMHPEARGTTITQNAPEGLKAIAAKDGITVIRIKSTRMFLAYGFLKKVFEIFEAYKTPIDMITTSEVAVSLTIDNTANLDRIVASLEQFCTVEVEHEMSIICAVGQNIAENTELSFTILDQLKSIPVRMVSFGGSKNNISMLVPTSFKEKALIAIHEGIFLKKSLT